MGSARTKAIDEAYKRNQAGRSSFYYVKTDELERLGITAFKTTGLKDIFIRIIPPKNDTEFWAKEVYVHRDIGANGAAYICLKRTFNKPCPICELIEEMKANGVGDDKIKPLYPQTRHLMFVIDVADDSTITKGLRWYDAPGMVVNNIISLSKDKRTKSVIDVSDPVEGRDIEFVRKGTGLSSKYEAFNLRQTDPIPEDWYSDVPDFIDVLAIPTYEQVLAALGTDVGESEEQVDEGPGDQTEEATETEEPVEQEQPTETAESEAPTPEPQRTSSRPSLRGNASRGNANRGDTGPKVSSDVKSKIDEIRRRRQANG